MAPRISPLLLATVAARSPYTNQGFLLDTNARRLLRGADDPELDTGSDSDTTENDSSGGRESDNSDALDIVNRSDRQATVDPDIRELKLMLLLDTNVLPNDSTQGYIFSRSPIADITITNDKNLEISRKYFAI